jgi:hypothetical protein
LMFDSNLEVTDFQKCRNGEPCFVSPNLKEMDQTA